MREQQVVNVERQSSKREKRNLETETEANWLGSWSELEGRHESQMEVQAEKKQRSGLDVTKSTGEAGTEMSLTSDSGSDRDRRRRQRRNRRGAVGRGPDRTGVSHRFHVSTSRQSRCSR